MKYSARSLDGVSAGSVPEWLKGTGCKPVGVSLRWFESSPAHFCFRGVRGEDSVLGHLSGFLLRCIKQWGGLSFEHTFCFTYAFMG